MWRSLLVQSTMKYLNLYQAIIRPQYCNFMPTIERIWNVELFNKSVKILVSWGKKGIAFLDWNFFFVCFSAKLLLWRDTIYKWCFTHIYFIIIIAGTVVNITVGLFLSIDTRYRDFTKLNHLGTSSQMHICCFHSS